MYGAKAADIKAIITSNVNKQIDTNKQQILDDGFAAAKYEVASVADTGPLDVTLTASSLAGPDIKIDALAVQLGGKKTGAVESVVKAIPGVTDVSVKYSPFWISSVPSNIHKIHIIIEKPVASTQPAQLRNGSSH